MTRCSPINLPAFRATVAVVAAILVAGVAFAAAATKPAAQASEYVGYKTCLNCHIKYRDWPEFPHSKALNAAGRKPGESGCESCHGPGAVHVNSDRKKITSFTDLSAEKRNAICLRCHSPKVTAAHWQDSAHAKLGFSCTVCHEMHKPAQPQFMLKQNVGENCLACHEGIKDLAAEGKHHKVPDSLDCRRCHSPHGSKEPHGLIKPKGELCKDCHGDGAASALPAGHGEADFIRTHGKPVKTDSSSCTGCHDQEKFCNSCHGTPMPHPQGWMMGHKDTASFEIEGACLKCHTRAFCRCHGEG